MARRLAASTAALIVGAVGAVGFASAAVADHGICVPSDAVTHTEHTYTRTLIEWAATSPGAQWAPTGQQQVVVDSPAVTHTELEYRKWNNGQDEWMYQWFRQDSPPNANSGWAPTGVVNVVVDTPAVTHVEYEYSRTETTGWLTESPGQSWIISDSRTVVDTPTVVCDDVQPSLTADRFQFRPGETVTLNAFDFLAGEEVEFVLNSEPMTLALGLADALGTATASSVAIPVNAPAGAHTIVATGLTSGRTASTGIEVLAGGEPAVAGPVTVTAPNSAGSNSAGSNSAGSNGAATALGAAATDGALAETGNESLLLLGLAGSLALIGGGLIGMRRVMPSLG